MMKFSSFSRGFFSGSMVTMSTNVALWYFFSREINSKMVDKMEVDTMQPIQSRVPTQHITEDTDKLARMRRILKYGLPDRSDHIRVYQGHVVSYDQSRRVPYWSAEVITPDNLSGPANRKRSKFQADSDVKTIFSSDNADYRASGWSRGHMTPAGNLKYSQKAMDDSFYLTNIVPQDFDNNSGFWNRFEMYCRDLAKRYDEVRVITGPLFLPNTDPDGKKRINHEVIGGNHVHVPTHLFKIIVAERDADKSKAVGAFIVPNVKLDFDKHLKDYQVPVTEIEARTGIEFLPNISRNHVLNLCSVENCRMLSQTQLENQGLRRDLFRSKDIAQLEKIWSHVRENKRNDNAALVAAYQKRRQELEDERKAAMKTEL